MTELEKVIQEVRDYRKQYIEAAKLLFDLGYFDTDRFPAGVISRSMSFSAGFLTLIEAKNYIAAIPFVRMQLDNVLRFYAVFLVSNPADFVQKYFDGKHIKDMLTSDGRRMYDSVLLDIFIKNNPEFAMLKQVYEKTSGYIHLSDVHSDAIIHSMGNNSISLFLSETIHVPEADYVKAVRVFSLITAALLEQIIVYIKLKENDYKLHLASQMKP